MELLVLRDINQWLEALNCGCNDFLRFWIRLWLWRPSFLKKSDIIEEFEHMLTLKKSFLIRYFKYFYVPRRTSLNLTPKWKRFVQRECCSKLKSAPSDSGIMLLFFLVLRYVSKWLVCYSFVHWVYLSIFWVWLAEYKRNDFIHSVQRVWILLFINAPIHGYLSLT